MIVMCNNKGIADTSLDGQQHQRRHSPPQFVAAAPPRVKFLCSFLGSILPRPQDGKLRYVGGETRIVSVPRDVAFDELMAKMRELVDGAVVLKYQQPDEDLDALVSVLNDEDVVNMMEEHDKLASSGVATRLRIFLFPVVESGLVNDGFVEDRDSERRYVDALNNLNGGTGFESPVDDLQHYLGSLELRRLSIPNSGGVQHVAMEAPWSPAAYYSPRPEGFPSSPAGFEQFSDGGWVQGGGGAGGLPGNIFQEGVGGGGGGGICEHCRVAFHRNFEPHHDCRNFHGFYANYASNEWVLHQQEGYPYVGEGVYPNHHGHGVWRNVPGQGHVYPNPWYEYNQGSRVVNSAAFVQDNQQQFFAEPEKEEKGETSDVHDDGDNSGEVLAPEALNPSCLKPTGETGDSDDKLSYLPEMIASAKKAALDGANDMKIKVEEENTEALKNGSTAQVVAAANELEYVNAHVDTELDSDSDTIDTSRIEPTKAEAEAFNKGLQTIKNDDLEEIRELGSGTYGAVYHGKWRGSDVAIKRIKASCFAGRPSERERLIADFWKEALILSSLHHPNVVSFYGIVRDGPDGTLATVTEFMINGSLKQFLQKKDRTIDRRKRLIIAMDAAFGMEYLHGKNIVHFDLKCENLLVNMRDPQRPVCKIGDLGLSKVKQHTLVSGGVRGTLPWMAPELLSGKTNMVTEKIDVYSFGIVMWELLTGEEPYADMHCASIIGGIVNNTLRPQIPTWCDPEWKSLVEGCWAADPASRPSFSEISQKLRNMAAAMNLK